MKAATQRLLSGVGWEDAEDCPGAKKNRSPARTDVEKIYAQIPSANESA